MAAGGGEFWTSRIAVQDLEGKGKGVVAVEAIPAHTLLVRERALELVKGGDEKDRMLVLNHLLQNVHVRVMRDPGVREQVFALYPDRATSDKEFEKRDPNEKKHDADDADYPPQLVEELNWLYNILVCNTFAVEDYSNRGEVMFGMFLKTSRFNHSCCPPCYYYFEDGVINIRTREAIAKGDEVTIAYCPVYASKDFRRTHLKQAYHFVCVCTRCTSQNDYDVVLDALACPTQGCVGYMTTDYSRATRCMTCDTEKPPSWVAGVHKELDRLRKAKPYDPASIALTHPRSDKAYQYYNRVLNYALKHLYEGKITPEARKAGLSCAKKALACVAVMPYVPEQHLMLLLKAASLAGKGERDQLLVRAGEVAAENRGIGDLKQFSGWLRD
eukprot:TRINITY_DN20983_c0_g1_i1.p1 TRINITY_DN20983_c0_g1~~TRINITY_DN20983_c0_g1_i1.p1  ORF type:complete len:386 (+),score=114.45 TRINITY_DN20983_c0_g1_i1:55-1212(+)